jgi:ribosomal protein S18 acetylase RimI-like enzyme
LILSIERKMKITPSIRAATMADAEMLTELAARTFYDAFAPSIAAEAMTAYMSQAFTTHQLSAELADPRAMFLIAEVEGMPAGYAKLQTGAVPDCVPGRLKDPGPIEIVRLYVDQQFHGRGVAQTLMQACLDRAAQSGHRAVFLGVWEHNPRAIAFYRKWKFEIVGSHVFQMGDEAQTDFWMARELQ